MANIMLNNRCNLNCEYCFANEYTSQNNDNITIEDFIHIVEFLKRDQRSISFGLIGGEPTLYPDLPIIFTLIQNDPQIKDVTLFTNGLLIDKYLNELNCQKISLFINCNSPSVLGDKKYKKLLDNIQLFYDTFGPDRLDFGINLYSPIVSYDYIFDILEITHKKRLRISVTVPNNPVQIQLGAISRFSEMKGVTYTLIHNLLKRNIVPYFDCNKIPVCMLTDDERIELIELFGDDDVTNVIGEFSTCQPVIDILQDRTAIRCFGLSDVCRIEIDLFSNLSDLRNYFINQIDVYSHLVFKDEKCTDCYERNVKKCSCGCLCYKLDLIQRIKGNMENEFYPV